MRFSYTPEGAEPRSWDFDPNRLMSPEAEAIERHTGMTFEEWGTQVGKGSMTALHGLLYVLLKRSDPTLRYDAVSFCLAEVDFVLDDDETRQAIATLEAKDDLTEAEQAALVALREAVDEAPKAPVLAPVSSDDSASAAS